MGEERRRIEGRCKGERREFKLRSHSSFQKSARTRPACRQVSARARGPALAKDNPGHVLCLQRCSLTIPLVRSLYITEFQAIVSIVIVYVVAPPTWDDLTHLALSGLVDSSNQVWREGTDLASVAREV